MHTGGSTGGVWVLFWRGRCFFWNVFTSQPLGWWLGISLVQTFVVIPLIIWRWGKGGLLRVDLFVRGTGRDDGGYAPAEDAARSYLESDEYGGAGDFGSGFCASGIADCGAGCCLMITG